MSRPSQAARPPAKPTLSLGQLRPAGPDFRLFDGEVYEGCHFEGHRFDSQDASDSEFIDCLFEDCSLNAASLRNGRFRDSRLTRVSAAELDCANSHWRNIEFSDVRLGAWEWHGARMDRVAVSGGKIDFINLRGAVIGDLTLSDCVIGELDLSGATARRLSLAGCRVERLVVDKATLSGVDLRGAEISVIQGIDSLRGTLISRDQLYDLAPALAAHLGVSVL
ncbi:pentapeptide repeat-containing protein [Saxibacter everestensis]|uniref:Pentapeptide repeat-containing protein n=1 Tax=Saxibacter everestensis TaxID=2909229 RepID=A0ABY8QVC4_9MICO|nr:pentapeptide repeat-containing protein [Brevibacteriaceae bacterium ZFBP1038]